MLRAMNKPYGFSFSEKHQIGLWDYGWFEVASYNYKQFDSAKTDFGSILDSLISNDFYDISYSVTEGLKPYEHKSTNRLKTHGPFQLEKIHASDFILITLQEFLSVLVGHYTDPKMSISPKKQQIERVNYLIAGLCLENTHLYKLNISIDDENFRHESCFHTFFYEYVIINAKENRLHICVIAYD